jgi:hypothetical protein
VRVGFRQLLLGLHLLRGGGAGRGGARPGEERVLLLRVRGGRGGGGGGGGAGGVTSGVWRGDMFGREELACRLEGPEGLLARGAVERGGQGGAARARQLGERLAEGGGERVRAEPAEVLRGGLCVKYSEE